MANGLEREILRRYEERQGLLPGWKEMKQEDKTRVQKEIQDDHQAVVAWEAKAAGDEKQRAADLKRLLEQQQQDFQQIDALEYQKKTLKLAPRPAVVKNTILAFVVGGLICTAGQVLIDLFSSGGLADKDASSAASTALVFAGALLTGFGIYDELGRVAGAGSIVPITGFANSIASSALEFKREGFIYGVGARLFTVAGPVIAYGTMVSIMIGLVYYFWK